MQMTAQGFLVYQLTRSPAYLGIVTFASGVPTWVLTLLGGVVADRLPRRTLLVITQTTLMFLAFVLAGLTFLGWVRPWHIVVLAVCGGIAQAFDAPARQSFVLEMVGREDLTNAIALNSSMFNLGTAVGPAAAGVIYALVGPAWCFMLNGISFMAIIVPLTLMKLNPMPHLARRASALSDLREGLRYVAGHSVIRVLIVMLGTMSLFGMAFSTLMPAWAVEVLGGGSTTNGMLQSARGIGSLISALAVASLAGFRGRGRLISFGTFALPAALFVFSAMRWLPLSLFALMAVGAANMLIMNLANAVVQGLVEDRLRGRVMSFYTLILFGMFPLGGLWAGAVAERFGEPAAVVLGASASLICAALVWLFAPRVRALE